MNILLLPTETCKRVRCVLDRQIGAPGPLPFDARLKSASKEVASGGGKAFSQREQKGKIAMMERREMGAEVWTANRIVALIIGVVFTIIGILGFFVSSSMTPGSLLGFDVDLVHNLVHLVTGLVALLAVYAGWPRRFNQVFGVIYLIIGILGLFYPALYIDGRLLGIMHVNAADHILHLVVGIIAAGFGFFVVDHPSHVTGTPTL